MVFLPHICISKIEEYKEGIDVFALAYRNHTDDHYMALMGDYPFHFEKLIDYKVWVIAAVTLVATCAW